jgi:hypothetical protein
MGRPAIKICKCGRNRKQYKMLSGKVYWRCKNCKKEYQIKKRKENPQYDMEWRKDNREKLRVQSKEFYNRNIEKQRVRSKIKYCKYMTEQPERVRSWGRKNSKGPRGRYGSYKKNAQNRSLLFEISFEEFMEFWKKNCEYCGSKIDTVGIDRVDNKIGYVKGNLKACCGWCNKMKMDHGEREFIEQCRKIVDYENM